MPKHLSHLDTRKEIKISLKTTNHKEALIKAEIYNNQIETFWKSLVQAGNSIGARDKYKAAVQLAKSHGFAYKTADQVAASTLDEIVNRLSVNVDSKNEVDALLGGVNQSQILLSECCELYWPLITDRLVNKTEHKIRKWKNPRLKAMANFIELIGDMPINVITRAEVLQFRNWWAERIKEGLSADSANKQFRYVRDIIQNVALNNEIDIDYEQMFLKTRFQYQVLSRRPFEAKYIQDKILPNLEGLPERYKCVIWVMADTGARISEIFGLAPEDIRLNDDIPFIWIRPREGYSLKTATSERQIPLVGTALAAFQKFPEGFNTKGNPDTFSNVVNNYLRDKNLRPTPKHSAYSFRHTFKDRLRDIEAPEEIIDGLMGHKKSGPKYGRGHKLETKQKWLKNIEFRVLKDIK